MVSAPHLPNKTCQIDTHYRLQSIKWILLFAVFAFVAGGSSAMIVSAWLIPNYSHEPTISHNIDNRASLFAEPDILWQKQTQQRLLSVYDRRLKPADKVFRPEALVASAAIFSSDGWAVMYQPDYQVGQEKFWQIIDSQAVNYIIEKTVFDRALGLVYFKIKANGLRVVAFPDWQGLGLGAYVWVGANEWEHHYIRAWQKISNKEIINISEPQYTYKFETEIPVGSLLWSEGGEFVGLLKANGNLIFSWQIEQQLAGLLSKGKLTNQSLSWQGYWATALGPENKEIFGFYLEKIIDKNVLLKRGDIILSINNEPISKYELARQIISAPAEFNLAVWRNNGEEMVVVKR